MHRVKHFTTERRLICLILVSSSEFLIRGMCGITETGCGFKLLSYKGFGYMA